MNLNPRSNFIQKFNARRDHLKSLLCIGLDPELEKLPKISLDSKAPLVHFTETIIRYTHSYAAAWKPNVAFFERLGAEGYFALEHMVHLMKEISPHIPIVMDAKRGDLANTSKEYAKYFFEKLGVDALTVNPYMGRDSLVPYLDLGGYIFVLGLTSNPSSSDFQKQKLSGKEIFLYEEVSDQMAKLAEEYPDQVGLVVGGTHPSEIQSLRARHPELYFLIPGFGAQGGDLKSIVQASGKRSLINSSRGITLSSLEDQFGEVAKKKSEEVHEQMNQLFL
ncbi:orotidine-5'-phosphate decarboxylase [Leptospira sp. 2 VSF19]|uniref:Orotidine-5'-phosphate decarboxylase n=1 Tax=Leptospira soteropolitanensis TaxID=2950025 RepID=A0AAW5VF71_9LEPT|nr:orotidine-5'-phosphate decarboxylase [Leptospira soteropolitanensis]MCW7492437.1 orotidine-5'-phosphate decarboxylase [Leptospira soteropolitanensis]MCW7500488.1 orotidine-5'-phosphate decarboxylase [Leptospira soteropolitanensis]MCW7522842.1 orotidine-5'-phosphate decarboxylase [Leptospira soteropolitanensis]MCW7526701.1 orotidine-5'-phosphate decarboxylase [Leptospira soteropolitanensis]MCW7530458.1 orotidine-5'-phosphate decarboxylase [Leptospira soteropolitanensis]